MSDERFTYLEYLKSAFGRRIDVPLLGTMPINHMGLVGAAILGLANPGFWFLGAALEVIFLVLRSTNPRFQKLVEGDRLLRQQKTFEERVGDTVAALSPEARERYRRLLEQCGQILGISPTIDSGGALRDIRAGGLNQLLWLFLRLLVSRQTIATSLAQVKSSAIEAEVDAVRGRLAKAEPDSALARSLQATLEIQIKRLENLSRARKSLELVDAELERIEGQVRLIREESAIDGGSELLSARLDAVTATMGETSRWMEQHAELFGNLALEDIDASSSALPPLPEIQVPEPEPKLPAPPREAEKQR